MERKHTPLYGIKGKLISAVCMLLVAVIMVVSSTYAWFTLSTAPEVSGISTAIGANGALEIKLNGNNAGDKRNNEYGNIVDLSDTSYGLNNITLLPSTLSALTDGAFSDSFLLFPTYGNDGRPQTTMGKTQVGVFDGTAFIDGDDTGVRAVGSVSGLTERQAAYRSASTAANTAMTAAKNRAASSLNENGGTLGNIVIKKATGDATTTYTQTELTALEAIVNDLEIKVVPQLETAYKNLILAYAASAKTDEYAATLQQEGVNGDIVYNAIASSTIDLATIGANDKIAVGAYEINIADTVLANGIDAYNTTVSNIASAKNEIATLKATNADMSWTDISKVLQYLIKYENVKVNGVSTNGMTLDSLANAITNNGMKVQVTMTTGAGVYADIADQCGNYTASILMEKVEIPSMSVNLTNFSATMNTETTVDPVYLQTAVNLIKLAGEPVGSEEGGAMTEIYGFILDFTFRTNAANSNLLLQTAPQNRIYADSNKNDQIMGKGSTMTFESVNRAEFSDNQVKALMENIRIVFFAPGQTNVVLGYAKLDVNNAEVTSDGVTANMYMYDVVKTYTYTDADSNTVTVYSVDGETFYSSVSYVDGKSGAVSSDVEFGAVAEIPADANLVAKADAKDMYILKADKSAITKLDQNVDTNISTLVYLDGKELENADVMATNAQSVTGKMNIQFSSSATLVPMEYGDLREGAAATENN